MNIPTSQAKVHPIKQLNRMGFLVALIFVDVMGLGLVLTLFPKLLLDSSFYMLPKSWPDSIKISSIGVFLAVYSLGQFFGAAILGRLSDKYHRKPILIMSIIGTLTGFGLSYYSLLLQSGVLLFISRLVAGAFSGNLAIAQASIADISTPEKKMRNMTILQFTIGIGWAFGPFIGGTLASPDIVSSFDMNTPFIFMMIMLTLILAWCILGFKETLLVANKDSNSSLKSIVDFSPVFKSQVLISLFIAWTFWNCGWWLFEAYLPTFLQQLWSYEPRDIGNFIGRMGTSYAIVQFLVLYLNTKRNTENTYKYFLFLAGLSIFGLGFSQEPWHLIATSTLWVIAAAFVLPIFATKFSNSAGTENQGQIMGLMSSVQSISIVLMMLIGGPLFVIGPRIPIIIGGFLLVLCWGFSFISVKLGDEQAVPTT